jgi:hypothetical protein
MKNKKMNICIVGPFNPYIFKDYFDDNFKLFNKFLHKFIKSDHNEDEREEKNSNNYWFQNSSMVAKFLY